MKLWEGLGYYNRVRNMQKAAIQMVEQYGGQFPESYEEIHALTGIGNYTAGAIGSFAFGIPNRRWMEMCCVWCPGFWQAEKIL